jgi:hypothetical protein
MLHRSRSSRQERDGGLFEARNLIRTGEFSFLGLVLAIGGAGDKHFLGQEQEAVPAGEFLDPFKILPGCDLSGDGGDVSASASRNPCGSPSSRLPPSWLPLPRWLVRFVYRIAHFGASNGSTRSTPLWAKSVTLRVAIIS